MGAHPFVSFLSRWMAKSSKSVFSTMSIVFVRKGRASLFIDSQALVIALAIAVSTRTSILSTQARTLGSVIFRSVLKKALSSLVLYQYRVVDIFFFLKNSHCATFSMPLHFIHGWVFGERSVRAPPGQGATSRLAFGRMLRVTTGSEGRGSRRPNNNVCKSLFLVSMFA